MAVTVAPVNVLSGQWIFETADTRMWLAIGVICLLPVSVWSGRIVLLELWQQRRTEPAPSDNPPGQAIVTSAMLIVGALILYSEIVYPLLLPTYGGGQPTLVRIILTPDGEAQVPEVATTGPWLLISETEHWVAITQDIPERRRPFARRRAVRVQRAYVAAIR